ncbi:MAG: type II toxin-antitoxin system HicB family antitoxin [Solirubrobacteraceae bacterium]
MELTVVVTRESGAFWSKVDELPGCFASGRTLSELRDALAEAIGMYLWDLPGVPVESELAMGEGTIVVVPPMSPGPGESTRPSE